MKGHILYEIAIYTKLLEKVATHKLAMGYISPTQIKSSLKSLEKMATEKHYYLAISGIKLPNFLFKSLFHNNTHIFSSPTPLSARS